MNPDDYLEAFAEAIHLVYTESEEDPLDPKTKRSDAKNRKPTSINMRYWPNMESVLRYLRGVGLLW